MEFIEGVEGRIKALAQTHEILSHTRWAGADVLRLVLDELAPYQNDRNTRVTAIGPAAVVSPEDAQTLAIALHELATNAAKYGSLSWPDGRVDVSWRIAGDLLNILWTESGGPGVLPPQSKGFGTKIITASFSDPRRGSVTFDWKPEGLSCELALRIGQGTDEESPRVDIPVISPQRSSSSPHILLVEDEVLVGVVMEEMLREMGYSVGKSCRSLKDAMAAATIGQFDGAVLDMNLNGELVYPVADLLTARSIPFVFVTGYAADVVDARFAHVPILQKPVTNDALAKVIGAWIGPLQWNSQSPVPSHSREVSSAGSPRPAG